MFKNPFSFSGRIRRTEYGLSLLIYFAFAGTLRFMVAGMTTDQEIVSMIFLILYIPLLWLMLAQGSKRCHDRGNTGWFQIIPFYGFWMLFADGENGINKYGANPKGVGNIDEIDEIGNTWINKTITGWIWKPYKNSYPRQDFHNSS